MQLEANYTKDPQFKEINDKRLALLNKLPPPSYSTNLDELITNTINLSMKSQNKDDYFISKKLKSAKEKPESDDLMQKMQKKFDIEEYGSNFTRDVYDCRRIVDESVADDKKTLKPTVTNSFNNGVSDHFKRTTQGFSAK